MKILSLLFPPKLPSPVTEWTTHEEAEDQGSCGNVRFKKHANGIERHFAEEAEARCQRYFGASYRQYMAQLLKSEKEMQRHLDALVAAGYVNTIHDYWEPNQGFADYYPKD